MPDTDFRLGDSITFEVGNKPYVDRTVPMSQNDYRAALMVWIKIYDPCGNIFVDCPMVPCSDRIGWYLFRLQTDDNYPLGLYKASITATNTVPESSTACSSGTSGTSGTPGFIITPETTASSGAPPLPPNYNADDRAIKYFRLISDEVL
jgi:hypothetical protein